MRRRGLGQLRRDWRDGRRYGYPLCCVAHFCWDGIWGWPSGMVRWRQIDYTRGQGCVPCGFGHAADSPHRSSVRLGRILLFNCRHLLPTQSGRRRRTLARGGGPRWRHAPPELKVLAHRRGEGERLYWNAGEFDAVLARLEIEAAGIDRRTPMEAARR